MKVVFMGTPLAAVPTLERILTGGHEVVAVWTQPDRPAGRGNKVTMPPVKEFAIEKGLPVYQPIKIKKPEALELFRSHNADVAVVVAYGRILPEGFLEAFPKGCINVHFSLLPKYRGAAPVNWAIANGEKETGVTTMRMDSGLDTGDILLIAETPIGADENAIQLMERLSYLGAELLSETLNKLDSITPQKQDDLKASFAPILKKEDGLIDWSMTAIQIKNHVLAFQPFPKSYTFFQGRRFFLWRANVYKDAEGESTAEVVLQADGDSLLIGCGSNTVLQVVEAQLEGKNRVGARDFINGSHIKVGDRLG